MHEFTYETAVDGDPGCSTVVDATGDGDLCVAAGAAWGSGRSGDGGVLAFIQCAPLPSEDEAMAPVELQLPRTAPGQLRRPGAPATVSSTAHCGIQLRQGRLPTWREALAGDAVRLP